MIQPITNIFDGSANETTHGCIRLHLDRSAGAPDPVICVKSYGNYQWQYLRYLSGAKWNLHREKISDMIPHLSSTSRETSHIEKKFKEMQKKRHKDYIIKKEKDTMIRSLCNILTPEQRIQWIRDNDKYKNMVCIDCGQYAPCLIKHKCIHLDCPGMCLCCYRAKNPEGFEICGCCNKKQELQCPICQDMHVLSNMVKSENCSHHVCWKCFGMAAKATRPLESCPLCRCVFWKDVCVEEDDIFSDDSSTDSDDSSTDSDSIFGGISDLLAMPLFEPIIEVDSAGLT